MTSPSEPNGPLNPTDEAVDAWYARQHQDTGTDLATMLDLNLGLHDILLAGHHRDMGSDLAGTLDLGTGLAVILPRPTLNETPPTQFNNFTDLLDWLSTAPIRRLTHRNRLRQLAIDTEIHHLASDRALARALARARTLDSALDRARTLALGRARALDRARDSALELDRDRDVGRARALALNRELDRARARALNRELDRARALELGRALDRDRELDRELDRARARARDLDLDRARALALALALALCGTMVRLGVGDLIRAINDQTSVDTSWLNPATIGAREADRLHQLCTDFTGVDLSKAQLSGLDLVGVRWSSATRWPPTDVDWIVTSSEPVGNGVYVIREAAASGGAVVVPDPVSV